MRFKRSHAKILWVVLIIITATFVEHPLFDKMDTAEKLKLTTGEKIQSIMSRFLKHYDKRDYCRVILNRLL